MSTLVISSARPPIYDRLLQRFGGVEWEQGDEVVAWNGVIYAKHELTHDVIVHEMNHLQHQQNYKGGPDAYLERYLSDGEFRMWEEVAAFRAQLSALQAENPPRADLAWCKEKFARDLCDSSVYDIDITHAQAIRMLSV